MKLNAIITLLRPKHWVKNSFVLAPLLFAGKYTDIRSIKLAILTFIGFCAAASAIYIFNDIRDCKADRLHPRKRSRPIASGEIPVTSAVSIMFIMIAIASIAVIYPSAISGPWTAACLGAYLLINIYYSISGKHQVIVDAFCIAIGFVLRVTAGAYAIGVEPTGWIVIITLFLSLFLGFGKRRGEIVDLQDISIAHRGVLSDYPIHLLDQIIVSTGTIAIISYAIYTLDADIIAKFGASKLYITVIPVAYGIFRYMYLLLKGQEGDPTELITKDPGLILTIMVWLICAAGIVFMEGGQFR